MNGIEIILSKETMYSFLKHGFVTFTYLGVLYKVRKLPKGDIYRLYVYNSKKTPKNPKEWSYLMNVEEPVCLDEELSSQPKDSSR